MGGIRFLLLPTFFFNFSYFWFLKGTNLKEYLKLVESDKELWNFNFCVDFHLILLQKTSLFFTFPFKNMYSVILC